MKKISILPLYLVAISLFVACSSARKTATASRDMVKGTWTLTNISYDGSVPLKLTLLGEGPEACLLGSEWVLPNNGYGTYNITANKTGCLTGERKIVWSYQLENNKTIFQYKRLADNTKAKDIEEGYKFAILSADNAQMSLQSEVNFEGRPFYINYTFSRQAR